jgi:AcrR family transcriptional regulator
MRDAKLVGEVCQVVNASPSVGGVRRGPYRLKRRASRMDETRRRITQAAVDLHQDLGPLATTVAAIADRAAVSRPTVYAHFPDERALFAACTTHYFDLHPAPDPIAWRHEPDPAIRLIHGLTELYRYWAEIEPMAARVLRDHRVAPDRVGQGFVDFMGRCRGALTEDWPVTGTAQRRLRAAVGHAVRFETWQSLVRDGGLSASEAVTVMTGAVQAAIARAPAARGRSRTLASRSIDDTR